MQKVNRHTLVFFFGWAFALSWLVWGTSIAQAYGVISFHIPQTLAFWGLIVATYLSAYREGGWGQVKSTFSRVLRYRARYYWYFVSIIITAALAMSAIGIFALFGGSHQVGTSMTFLRFLTLAATETIFMIFTEETAWRGFALPQLLKNNSPFMASLILGMLWGLWHIPLFLIPGSAQTAYPFIGFLLLILPTSVMFTWLYQHTQGSILLAGILHGFYDATVVYLGVLTGDIKLFWIFVLVSWIFALTVSKVRYSSENIRSQKN